MVAVALPEARALVGFRCSVECVFPLFSASRALTPGDCSKEATAMAVMQMFRTYGF